MSMKSCADSEGMGAVFASMPKAWTLCFGVGAPNTAALVLALLAGMTQAAPNTIKINADPSVTVKVTPRAGNTSKTILVTVNKQDRVVVNGAQVYPLGGSVRLSWTPSGGFTWPPTIGAIESDRDTPPTVSYIVLYKPSQIMPGPCPDCQQLTTVTPSVVVPGLDPKLNYTFAVIAVDANGIQSEPSFAITKRVEP